MTKLTDHKDFLYLETFLANKKNITNTCKALGLKSRWTFYTWLRRKKDLVEAGILPGKPPSGKVVILNRLSEIQLDLDKIQRELSQIRRMVG